MRIFEAASGTIDRALMGHNDAVNSVAYSPDGQYILTASKDHDAMLWDAERGAEPLQVISWHYGDVSDASFSPDGRWILTAGPRTVGLWQGQPGSTTPVLPSGFGGNEDQVTSAVFDPTGRYVLSTAKDGSVRRVACEICIGLDELLALAEARLREAGRELTAEEREEYGLD